MKILIDNRTQINNMSIGKVIDEILNYEKDNTQYYGKESGYEITCETNYGNKINLDVQTFITKRYLKFIISEAEN